MVASAGPVADKPCPVCHGGGGRRAIPIEILGHHGDAPAGFCSSRSADRPIASMGSTAGTSRAFDNMVHMPRWSRRPRLGERGPISQSIPLWHIRTVLPSTTGWPSRSSSSSSTIRTPTQTISPSASGRLSRAVKRQSASAPPLTWPGRRAANGRNNYAAAMVALPTTPVELLLVWESYGSQIAETVGADWCIEKP